MDLTINHNQPRTYTNKYLKNAKDEKFSLGLEDKKDYEQYTKSHMLHSAYYCGRNGKEN